MSPNTLPDLQVDSRDPTITYNTDARARAQLDQQNQEDIRASRQRLENKFTQERRLQDFYSEQKPTERTLMTSFNVASGSDNIIPVTFKGRGGQGTEERGFFRVQAGEQSLRDATLPSDDEAYVPLVFTDLRPLKGGIYRSVYFRPFIKSLTEDFAPDWNMSTYFGRVDPIATYQNTNRTISLTFTLTCFSKQDLQAMYQKLGWLTSMVYPQYRQNTYYAGPAVRMRVGDIINAVGKEGNRGLPGVITSLSLNYDEATWELDANSKVPRLIEVSLSFHVLHEFPIGVVRGVGGENSDNLFGGIRPGGGASGQESSFVNIDRFRATFGKDYLNDTSLNAESPPSTGNTDSSTSNNGSSS